MSAPLNEHICTMSEFFKEINTKLLAGGVGVVLELVGVGEEELFGLGVVSGCCWTWCCCCLCCC